MIRNSMLPTYLDLVEVACPFCNDMNVKKEYAKGEDFEYHTVKNSFIFNYCLTCDVIYLASRPDVSDLGTIYPENYIPYSFDSQNIIYRIRRFLEEIKVRRLKRLIPENAKIMDAGCGGPGFLNNLKKYGKESWRLYGNDISINAIENIKKAGFYSLPGRFEQLKGHDKSFDVIFFKQVIEHLEDPKQILEKSKELLKSGGYLIIETPNIDSWDAKIFQKGLWGGYHIPRHWVLFSQDSLKKSGEAAGLDFYSLRFMLSPSFWIQSLHHYFEAENGPGLSRFFSHLNPVALALACLTDIVQIARTGKTSNMQMIFKNKNKD